MAKRRNKTYSPPVRLPSEIKHTHQAHYLYSLNKDVPELSRALKDLSSLCIRLFGETPMPTPEEEVDTEKLWSCFFLVGDAFEERSAWFDMLRVFRECVSIESRNNFQGFEWLGTLARTDSDLQKIDEYEESIREAAFKYIEELNPEELERHRDIFSYRYTKAKETLDVHDIQYAYLDFSRDWYYENRPAYRDIIRWKNSKLEPLKKFQEQFDEVVERFGLTKDWLALSAFQAIWNSSGHLRMDAAFVEDISQDVTKEIIHELNPVEATPSENGNSNAFAFFEDDQIPLPNPFQFEEKYWIYMSFDWYEERAVEAYRLHLTRYFQIVKRSLKNHDYKERQGDKYDYSRVEWLVAWNTSAMTKADLLQQIDAQIDPNKSIDASTIDKAFQKFKSYDLPVRQS